MDFGLLSICYQDVNSDIEKIKPLHNRKGFVNSICRLQF